jgi:glutamate carboxypeptidase
MPGRGIEQRHRLFLVGKGSRVMLKLMRRIVSVLLLSSVWSIVSGVGDAADKILQLARDERSAAMNTWRTLVNIDTGSGYEKGLAQAKTLLVQTLKAMGANVRTTSASPSAGDNVVGTLRGTGEEKILLMIHYDTVFPEGAAVRRPFRVEAGRAYGPGVADAKGGAVIILHAIQMLKDLAFDDYGRLTILFNPDEETGSLGSRSLIRGLASRHDYVLSFEPPDQEGVTVQTNGINQLMLRVEGRASHAGAAPEEGRNAAIELAHQLLQLNDLGDPDKGTTVNWTIVNAGKKANIIPALATAEADMRYSDLSETERVMSDARRIIREHLIPDTEVQIRWERGRPPLLENQASLELAALAVRVYEAIGRELNPIAMRFGTDAGYAYRPGSPKPAVLETLGVVGGRLHSPEEFAELESLAPRLYLTAQMIMELSRGD